MSAATPIFLQLNWPQWVGTHPKSTCAADGDLGH